MNEPRVMPSTRMSASPAAGDSDEIALDDIAHLLHVERAAERSVRERVAAGELAQLRGMTRLDRVDRQRGREHLTVLDLVDLAEVRGHARVLERGGGVERPAGAADPEVRDRSLGGPAAELL